MNFVDWVLQNKEWIFSGIGVFAIGSIIATVKRWRKHQRSMPRNTQTVRIDQRSSGLNSPNIAQVGNNNQATIITRRRLVLDREKHNTLVRMLSPFSGRNIKILLNRETTETLEFGNAVAAAFSKSGIRVVEIGHMMVLGAVPPGVSFILSKTNKGDVQFAQALAAAFNEIGIAKGKVQAEYGNNDVFILYITPL